MYFPMELLSQILQETAKICSLQELLKLRAVNFFFASELESFWMSRVELHAYGSRDSQALTPLASDSAPKIRWLELPDRMKRSYLYRKIQLHNQSRTVWSTLVKEIIDLPNQRTIDETETLINQLIDACLCGEFSGCKYLLDPDQYTIHIEDPSSHHLGIIPLSCEGFETTLRYALATSAIQSGDCRQLQILLDQGIKLDKYSNRLAVVPLDIAAKKGSGPIIELLLANHCPMKYLSAWDNRLWYWGISYTKVSDVMAVSGNDRGLSVWIEHMIKEGQIYPKFLRRTMTRAVIGGHIKVIELVQEKYEALYGNPRWDAHMLVKAIRYGSLDAIRYLFRRGQVDVNTRTNPSDRALLPRLLYNGRRNRRSDIVNFLLENGADPNGNEPPKKKTPFEVAVRVRDYESATVLLKHRATVNFKRMMPLLLGITGNADVTAALLQLLWPGGSNCRTYRSEGRSYTLAPDARDAKTIRNIENVFLDLGWSEQEVKAVEIKHFIDVYRK